MAETTARTLSSTRRLRRNDIESPSFGTDAALQQGDANAARILNDTAADLAFALSHVVHLFHPQILIVGGGLSAVGEPLRAAVEKALGGFLMDAFAPGPRVTLAALGEDAVPTGALALATGSLPD